MKGFHPCRWHSGANFNILLQCSLWWSRRTDYSHYIADCHLLLFWSPISSWERDALLLFHYFLFTFVLYFASLFLFHFCMQHHVGPFPISTSALLWKERRYTIAFKKISHYRNTFLLVFHYFPITSDHARLILGGKCLPFFFFFLFDKCRFSSSLFFYLLPVVRPSFLRFTVSSYILRSLDYGERAFTTRPCANIFYVFKVCCSYVDSLSGISADNILKCCF